MPSAFMSRPSAQRRQSGFVHNEAIANELAARFYTARGFDKIANTYLRDARVLLSAMGGRRQGAATRQPISAPQTWKADRPTRQARSWHPSNNWILLR